MTYIYQYFIAILVFLGIDAIWLMFIAKSFYAKNIGHLLAEKPNLVAAFIFYLLNIIGLVIFAINPAIQKNSLINALIFGALFGFFTYSTYDLTNLATLKDWPLIVSVIDIIWGTLLSATVSGLTYVILQSFLAKG